MVLACLIGSATTLGHQDIIKLPADVELARLVDLSSERLGLRVSYEPRQLSGSFMVRNTSELDDDALWTMTNELLVQKGLTTVAVSERGTMSVVQLSEAASLAPPVSDWILGQGVGRTSLETQSRAGFVAITIGVEQADPEVLIAAVDPLLSSRGSLTRLGGTNSFIVADLRERAAEVVKRVESLDVPTTITRSYEPRVFSPSEVGKAVRRLVSEDIHVLPDDLTGTLLVEATIDQHESIAALVDRFEAEQSAARLSTRTIMVRNRPVEEIVSLVNRLLGAGAAGRPDEPAAADHGTARPTPAAPTAAERARNRTSSTTNDGVIQIDGLVVSLVADAATSRILAIGPPGVLDRVQELVRELDVRQPQVMLEVTMASLAEAETLDLGVEFERIEVSGDVRIRLASLFGLSKVNGNGTRDAGEGAGFTGVVLDPGDFAVVVRALETANQGRSLSLPHVLLDNAATATLDAVREGPFVSTNASDTVATTSFGGSASAGTQITVTLRIAEGDHLLLKYAVSLSQFVGESASDSVPPPRQENSITTSIATIPDGHAIVLGGLETMNEGEATSQVPLLGDIPWLGEFLKNRSRSSGRTKFYVFIRSTITHGDGFEYLKYVSQDLAASLDADDGFSVVEPQVI